MRSARRRHWIWGPLVAGSVVGVGLPTPTSDLVLGLVVLTAMGLTLSSAQRLRGLRGWRVIIVGSILIGFAPVITEVHRAIEADPGPLTVGDGVLLGGYLLFLIGVRRVLTARTMDTQARSAVDATLITLWLGFLILAWAGPQLTERLSGYPLVASLIYLPLSLGSVHLILRLVLGSDSRSGSVVLLACSSILAVASEIVFLAVASGRDEARWAGVALATLSLVTMAAAVRHPSATEIETPVAGQQQPLTLARSLWMVASFAMVAASFALVPRPPWYLASLLVAIGLGSGLNLFLTIRERERLIVVERTLRLSLGEVIRAKDPTSILERASRAAAELLADKTHVDIELVRFDQGRWLTCLDDGDDIRLGADIEAVVGEARRSGRIVREEGRSERPGIRFATDLAIPVGETDDHIDVLFVEASPVLTTLEIEQLTQVTGAINRALVAYELREANHQRRADRRFRALVQDSSDVVTVLDPETLDVAMVSPSLYRILGHREEVLVGDRIAGHVHPDDVVLLDQLVTATLTDRSPASPADLRLRHANGHYQWFSATVRDHTDDDEVGGVVLNLNDIHRRKLAELSLGFSEQRYRALVLNSRDVFAVLEPDLTINYVSPNVESVLGYSAADLMATDMATLLPDSSAARLGELVTPGGEAITNQTMELEVRTRHGDLRIAEVTVSDRADERGFLLTLADVTERRQLEKSLRDQALFDPLTGLANRSTLHHELQTMLQRLEPGRVLGVVHIDLGELKEINQSVGFEAGDELLIQVATRLRSRLRSNDMLARVGSHELAAAVETTTLDDVLRLARLLRLQFDDPFPVAGRSRRLGAAVGVDSTDDRSTVASDMLNQAALAASDVSDGSGGVRVFEPSLRSDATTRFELVADLEGAVSAGELHVVYQPIMEIASSTIRGVEALLRWNHPKRGPISPGMFIPLAEKSGQIRELGRWVLREACRQLEAWDARVPGAENLGVSVNVSALQLEEEGEAGRLAQIVFASDVEPGRITIELTESTLIEDPAFMRAQLQAFRDLGMRVAVDDFGTGAAGLSHLRDVPFNVIKIDKSYVDALSQSEDAERLVRAVIDLAHTMGATTVAEGIEEPRELELLRSLGCDLGQGFYLARPMEPTQLEDWFARGRAGSAPALIAAERVPI